MHRLAALATRAGLIAACGLLAPPAVAQSFLDKLLDGAKRATESVQKLQQTTTEFTEEQERDIGRQWASVLLGAAPLVDNPELQRYINQLGRWIALHSDRPNIDWTFGVFDTTAINAFATPGGYVFVTRGLLVRTRDEAELAGVLAHEIVHVARRHHLNAMKSSASMALGADLFAWFGQRAETRNAETTRRVVSGARELMARGLDKDDEYEADRLGAALAARAGFDPWGLPGVLQTMNALSASDNDASLLLATHPSAASRLDAIGPAITPELEQRPPRIRGSDSYRRLVDGLRESARGTGGR
jgi:predicted Zn-dependent protease